MVLTVYPSVAEDTRIYLGCELYSHVSSAGSKFSKSCNNYARIVRALCARVLVLDHPKPRANES